MSITATGWKNKKGTALRSCKCESWKKHWINCSGREWPKTCSVLGCSNDATLGAHIYNTNPEVTGEYIIPACDECNKRSEKFSLKESTCLVSANKQKTCEM